MAKSKKKNAEFEKLSKLIEKNPNDFQNYYDRAQECFSTDFMQALDDLNKCIELNPNFADAYNSRACIYFHDLKDYEKAIEDNTKMIELEEREYPHASRDAYWNRADCYSFLKNYEKAVADYTKAIEIHILGDEELKSELGEGEYFVGDEYFEIHLGRGNAYLNLKEYEKAILDFDKIIELNRADYVDEAYYKRGVAYKALGENEKANADFKKAEELGYEE